TGLATQAFLGSGPPRPEELTSRAPAPAGDQDLPCSHWWGEHTVGIPPAYGRTTAPTELCGYTPAQMRHAYGVDASPYRGKGATVAIILPGRLATMERDANRFFAAHGLPGFAPGQYTENLGPHFNETCGEAADALEETLDVETVHIVAPE